MTQHESDEADNVGTVGKVISGWWVYDRLRLTEIPFPAVLIARSEVRLVDPVTGEDVARGEEGELWVRGPQVMM